MCGLDFRRPQNKVERVFFFERGFDRQVHNSEELCLYTKGTC